MAESDIMQPCLCREASNVSFLTATKSSIIERRLKVPFLMLKVHFEIFPWQLSWNHESRRCSFFAGCGALMSVIMGTPTRDMQVSDRTREQAGILLLCPVGLRSFAGQLHSCFMETCSV